MGATTPVPKPEIRRAVVVTQDRLLLARLRVLLEQDGFVVVEADTSRPISSVRRSRADIVVVAAEGRTRALCARMREYAPVLDASALTEAQDDELVQAIADVITCASDAGTQAEIVSLFGSDDDTYVDPHGLVAEEILATDPREVDDMHRTLEVMEREIVDLGEQLSGARRSLGDTRATATERDTQLARARADAEGLKYAVELALARNRALEAQHAASNTRADEAEARVASLDADLDAAQVARAALQDRCDAAPKELQQALDEMEGAFERRVQELEAEHAQDLARANAAHEVAVAEVEAAGAAALAAQYLWFSRQLRK